MNKSQIAETLRREVGHLELAMKQQQERCERLKRFVLDLEAEIDGQAARPPEPEGKFRKVIDKVFGEEPPKPKR